MTTTPTTGFWAEVKAWLRQDSTVTGLGVFAALAVGTVTQALGHQIEWTAAASTITAGLVHLAMPGNSAAQAAASKVAYDLVQAAMQKKLAASLPELFADSVAVAQALHAPAPVTTTTTTGTPT